MRNKADVIIIGGGVIGSAIAYYLSLRKKRVILIEKDDFAAGASGSCDQNILIQTKSLGLPLKLGLASINMFEDLEKELNYDLEYRRNGGLILIENEIELKMLEKLACKQRGFGLNVEFLNRKELNKMQQGLASHIIGSTYCPIEAHINPIKLTIAFALAAQSLGAEILLNTEVTGLNIATTSIRGVETSKGIYASDIVILAAGVWTPLICKTLNINIPIKPRRGQIVITEPVPSFAEKNILSAKYILSKLNNGDISKKYKDAGLSLSQSLKGNLLIGATREFVGYDISNTPEGITNIVKNAIKILPQLKYVKVIRTMAGLRPHTPDGLPLLGPVESIEGLYIAAGHEGDGICLSPITGKIMAGLIIDGKTFLDVDALSPKRFIRES